jgi:hypothetical protein
MPARLVWALLALVLAMAGYLVVGVGAGIGCAWLGSLAHDALAGPRERL